VVPLVAVVEPDLELDPVHDLGLDPVRLDHAKPVEKEALGVLERGDRDGGVAGTDAVSLEATFDQIRAEWRLGRRESLHELEAKTPR
jgi:hypothetical protein